MSYVDTSVIVAALDRLDPRFERARRLLESEETKVVSELVLVELASVVARREELVSDVARRAGLSKEEAVIAILLYIIKRFNLRYRGMDVFVRLPLVGRVYKPMAIAIELSQRAKFRALDLLHLAYAKLMKDGGEPIQRFITADKDFEKARKVLEEMGVALHVLT